MQKQNNETVVEFQAIRGDDYISGYMFVEDCDDEQPLHFYDQYGLEMGTNLPYSDSALYEAFTTDGMLIQYLVDHAEENVTIEREGYTLHINEGAKMEVEITSIWDLNEYEWGANDSLYPYWAKCIFKFNNENLAKIIGNQQIIEMMEEMQSLYDFENGYLQKGAIFMEMPKDIYEDDESFVDDDIKEEIIEEYLDIAREYLAKHLTEKNQIGEKFGDMLEQALDQDTDEEWLYKFLSVDKDNLKEFFINEGYELEL